MSFKEKQHCRAAQTKLISLHFMCLSACVCVCVLILKWRDWNGSAGLTCYVALMCCQFSFVTHKKHEKQQRRSIPGCVDYTGIWGQRLHANFHLKSKQCMLHFAYEQHAKGNVSSRLQVCMCESKKTSGGISEMPEWWQQPTWQESRGGERKGWKER